MAARRMNPPFSMLKITPNLCIPAPVDSPPSLIFSDLSDESEVVSTAMPVLLEPVDESPDRSTDMMDVAMDGAMESLTIDNRGSYVDASIIVQQVLSKLDSVVEHLRNKDEYDAANAIARNTLEIVNTFNNVTAPWDLQTFQMAPPARRPAPELSNAGTSAQARPAVATARSWASVAAKAVKNGHNPIIKYQPSDAIVKRYKDPHPTSQDMRVVWVQNWHQGRPLGQISEYVTQGPICSMAYAPEHTAVCVVFMYAESAHTLVESCQMYEEEEGECLFGRGCSVQLGQACPMSDELKRMAPPINERRRLTFARSQMFAHGMTETRFRDDIYELVGERNVELVWLFNSGNATVVFTSTKIARIVRDNFLRRSKMRGPYENVHVSYSHDPCEKPMNLITQIGAPSGGRSRSDSTRSSNGNSLHRSNTRNSGGVTRRRSKREAPKQDDDGWQTVSHKK